MNVLRDTVSLIACEDTRQTQKLLEHFEIRKPLVSYHDHNEAARTADLLERLSLGESIALVSDAGTPLVSDPGYRLVVAAIENGYPVVPIPGASAALAALTASGLPLDQFRFIGFLPSKATRRRKLFEDLSADLGTIVAYESPHRILSTLEDIEAVLGNRRIVLARELTKVHEEFLRGRASDLRQTLENRPAIKGEFTLLIAKADRQLRRKMLIPFRKFSAFRPKWAWIAKKPSRPLQSALAFQNGRSTGSLRSRTTTRRANVVIRPKSAHGKLGSFG